MEKVRIGRPYERILADANIVRCKHPNIKYSDIEIYKKGHIFTYSEESWESLYSDYNNLPEIKSGDLVLNGREDKSGGMVVNRLVDINVKRNGSKALVYEHTYTFNRVDLLEPIPINVNIEDDIENEYRMKPIKFC